MKKSMFSMTLIFLAGLLLSGAAYHFTQNQILYAIAITFGTIFYHFAMRLAVGYIVDAKFHNKMDYTKTWFQEKGFERNFYKKIKIKKWKKRVPTFNPEEFSLSGNSIEDIIQVTCQAEIVHEIIMVLSFVPVAFSPWFGSFGVFLTTSCGAFLVDSVFVLLQRYNRPRLMRLLKK